MKANELRIGNWVYEYGTFYKIEDGHDIDLMAGRFDPIVITPEILAKCGLIENSIGYFGGKKFSFNQMDFEFYKEGFYLCECIEGNFINNKPMIFLHELQNLYFALTGEELNINLQ